MRDMAHPTGKKYRLSEFFDQWWDEYVQHPKHYITQEQYKAVAAMRACRTEALESTIMSVRPVGKSVRYIIVVKTGFVLPVVGKTPWNGQKKWREN